MRLGRLTLYLFCGIFLFSACVPNRKIVYLQKNDLNKGSQIPLDTVVRMHQLKLQEYRIRPQDILFIHFESLTGGDFDFLEKLNSRGQTASSGGGGVGIATIGILVDVDGDIEFPVMGKVKVSGLTLFEAQDTLRQLASSFVKDVIVRVRLLNFRFTVLGEVNSEQTVTSLNTQVTLPEAIGMSGGLSELADRQHIKVIRQIGDSAQVHYINMLDESFVDSPYYYIQQNDVIIVPPLRQRPFRRYFAQNTALFVSTLTAVIFIVDLLTR